MLSKVFKSQWFLLAALCLLNIGIKLPFIASNGIALDEPFSIFYSQLVPSQLCSFLFTGDNPPLFELLLHFWIKVWGISPLSVRFLPMLYSSLTVIYVYLLGSITGSKKTGLVAGMLYTFSTFHIYFAHEARTYSLFTLLSTASLYYYFSLDNKKGWKPLFLLVISNVLLSYCHYFGFLVIAGELFFSFFYRKGHFLFFHRVWRSFLLLLIFLLPLVFILPSRLLDALRHGGTWVSKPPLDAFYENIRKFSNQPVVAVLFLLVVVFGMRLLWKRKRFKGHLILAILPFWFWGLYCTLFIISFFIPVFLDRYLIFLSVPFYLLVAYSSEEMAIPKLAGLVPVGCCLAMIVTVNFNPGNERDPEHLAAYIRHCEQPGTALFIAPPWIDKGLMYYADPIVFKAPAAFQEKLLSKKWISVFSVEEIPTRIPVGTKQIIFVSSGSISNSRRMDSLVTLSSTFILADCQQFGKTEEVCVYQLKK
jgi:mannosyltransferase